MSDNQGNERPESAEVPNPRSGDNNTLEGTAYKLTEADKEWVKKTVDEIGPLTEQERQDIARIFQSHKRHRNSRDHATDE